MLSNQFGLTNYLASLSVMFIIETVTCIAPSVPNCRFIAKQRFSEAIKTTSARTVTPLTGFYFSQIRNSCLQELAILWELSKLSALTNRF